MLSAPLRQLLGAALRLPVKLIDIISTAVYYLVKHFYR